MQPYVNVGDYHEPPFIGERDNGTFGIDLGVHYKFSVLQPSRADMSHGGGAPGNMTCSLGEEIQRSMNMRRRTLTSSNSPWQRRRRLGRVWEDANGTLAQGQIRIWEKVKKGKGHRA